MNDPVLPKNATAGRRWASAAADYEAFSEHFADAIVHCVERADIRPGERVLDLATGTGKAARLLAKRTKDVVAIDFGEALIAAARDLAHDAGVSIDFRVGDAEALAFEDASFDVVVSSFGVIFATDHERAATEVKRVCKPGGRVVMTAWTADGVIARCSRDVFARYMPKPQGDPPPSPFLWGSRDYAIKRLSDAFDLEFEDTATVLRSPTGEAVWEMWSRSHGPTRDSLAIMSAEQQKAFAAEFCRFYNGYRQADGIVMPREYLVISGVRR